MASNPDTPSTVASVGCCMMQRSITMQTLTPCALPGKKPGTSLDDEAAGLTLLQPSWKMDRSSSIKVEQRVLGCTDVCLHPCMYSICNSMFPGRQQATTSSKGAHRPQCRRARCVAPCRRQGRRPPPPPLPGSAPSQATTHPAMAGGRNPRASLATTPPNGGRTAAHPTPAEAGTRGGAGATAAALLPQVQVCWLHATASIGMQTCTRACRFSKTRSHRRSLGRAAAWPPSPPPRRRRDGRALGRAPPPTPPRPLGRRGERLWHPSPGRPLGGSGGSLGAHHARAARCARHAPRHHVSCGCMMLT